jgi:serine/threonine-protein kinase
MTGQPSTPSGGSQGRQRSGSGSTPPGGSRSGSQPPTTPGFIGRYQVLEKIGEGGMGSLFLARDPAIDRLVAIKLLRHGLDTEALRERFSREARAAGRLRHTHIVTIFDVGEHDGTPFIAMEFLAGETVAELVRNGARLSLSRRLRLLEELCDGLSYAHRAGLVHRDVKPANLMVDADGVLKILDFGIVRVGDSGMTQAGALVGTVNYMSPEQVVGGTVDHRSDIFAVGLVAYELISGRQAFPGTMKEGLLNRILNVTTEPIAEVVPGIDPEVAAIVEQAMQKDPADRYQDLVRMRNDLGRVRLRIEREEEQAAAAAAADAGETAIISEQPTIVGEGSPAAPNPFAQDAELALASGDFRAALTLAGRSAAIDPHDRTASSIAARAEAALLDRGRELHTGVRLPVTPVSGTPTPQVPDSGSGTLPGSTRALWVAVAIALLALAVAVVALWSRGPRTESSVARDESSAAAPAGERPSNPSSSSGTAAAPTTDGAPSPSASSGSSNGAAPANVAPEPPHPPEPPAAEPAGRTDASAPPSPTETGSMARGEAVGTDKPSSRVRREADRRPEPRTPASSSPASKGPAPRAASEKPATAPSAPAPAPVSGDTPEDAAPPASPLRVGVDASAPRQTRNVPASYPADAQAAGLQGTVDLELTIGPDGHVAAARVVKSVARALDDAAVAAVKQWEFAPVRRNGEAVSLIYPVSVPFRLADTVRTPPAVPGAVVPRPSAPSTPPPAPKPADTARAAPASDPREEIQAVLRRYKAAWEGLNPEALDRVQALSKAEAEDVRRSMDSANSYRLDMSVQSITVDSSGHSAVARVEMTWNFRPKIGISPGPQRRTSTVRLEKRGDAWVITGIR